VEQGVEVGDRVPRATLPLGLGVEEGEGVVEAEAEAEGLLLRVEVPQAVGEDVSLNTLAVAHWEAVAVRVREGVEGCVRDGGGVKVCEGVPVGEEDPLRVPLATTLALGVAVSLKLRVGVGLVLVDRVTEKVGVWEEVVEGQEEEVEDTVADTLSLAVEEGVGVMVNTREGLPVDVSLEVGLGVEEEKGLEEGMEKPPPRGAMDNSSKERKKNIPPIFGVYAHHKKETREGALSTSCNKIGE
jgi:hypothetical protein